MHDEIKQNKLPVIKGYLSVLRMLPRRSVNFIGLIFVGGLLESLLMPCLYPVIATGMGESSSKLDLWFSYFESINVSRQQVLALHLAAFLLLGSLCSVARWIGEARAYAFRGVMDQNSRKLLANSLRCMSWQHFVKVGNQQSLQLIVTSCDKMAEGTYNFFVFTALSLSAIAFLVALVYISPILGLVSLLMLLVGLVVQNLISKRSRMHADAFGSQSTHLGVGYAFLLNNLKYCRSSGHSIALTTQMDKTAELVVRNYKESHLVFAVQRVLMDIGALLLIAGILSSVSFLKGVSFSEASVFLGVLSRMVPRIVAANINFQLAISHVPHLRMWINAVKSAEDQQDMIGGSKSASFKHEIAIKNVSFAYSPDDTPVLQNLSLRISKGDFIAVVGESGSGKSTVFDLLTGLLAPISGEIDVDGVPLAELSMSDWRKRIGLVMQETPLIAGTILDNIAFLDPNPDIAWAKECAILANAWEFIERMPSGLKAVVGDKQTLSGGESQRIALARALYARPDILILDEPTSALDAMNEEKFVQSLQRLRGTVTILMATHRPSTARFATEVVQLDRGKSVKRAG